MQSRDASSHRLVPLCSALLLGLATQANAVSLNPDGQGQVLLFPYYSVNGGLVTVMSLTNHTDRVKAVKVRFLEAQNSREALDFNLYLSPFDQWTGALIDAGDAEGPAFLLSEDTSCIAPMQVPVGGQAFVNYQYIGANADGGPTGLDRTRDGHIEIIEMGVVGDGQGAAPFQLATAATHNPQLLDEQGRVLPNDCGKIRAAWQSGGVWRVAPNTDDDVSPPTGGLSGSAAIIDVAQGIAYPYVATALEGFYERPDVAHSPLHGFPGSIIPNLAQAEDLIVDPEGGTATALIQDGNTVLRMSFREARFRAISALLMRSTIGGDFNTEAGMGASSEWVVTSPTKGLHVSNIGLIRRPFISSFGQEGACEPAGLAARSREGQPYLLVERSSDIPFPLPDPPETERTKLCHAVSAIRPNQEPDSPSSLLQIPTERTFAFEVCARMDEDGWCLDGPRLHEGRVEVQLGNKGVDFATDGVDSITRYLIGDIANEDGSFPLLAGLPVLGLNFARYVNGQVEPGVLANYSTLTPLSGQRYTAPVQGIDAGGAPIPLPPPAADEAP